MSHVESAVSTDAGASPGRVRPLKLIAMVGAVVAVAALVWAYQAWPEAQTPVGPYPSLTTAKSADKLANRYVQVMAGELQPVKASTPDGASYFVTHIDGGSWLLVKTKMTPSDPFRGTLVNLTPDLNDKVILAAQTTLKDWRGKLAGVMLEQGDEALSPLPRVAAIAGGALLLICLTTLIIPSGSASTPATVDTTPADAAPDTQHV